MKVEGREYRSIWLAADGRRVEIIDQTRLPHEFRTVCLATLADGARAIRDMLVRGAPLIGATAAYGFCLGLHEGTADRDIDRIGSTLTACRPTAVNLRWAVEQMRSLLLALPAQDRLAAAYLEAARICDEDVRDNEAIGTHGLEIIRKTWEQKGKKSPVQVLTHCNAGWLATVDWGTALAPVYKAHEAGIPIHVWVDETRPRNQGAGLTAWELAAQGIDHHLIVDNAGGHLMQHGRVDLCIVGTDRTTAGGDVCNKIGTYLKALAARDNKVPFYVALPGSTIDWGIENGRLEIPIEERAPEEVLRVHGKTADGAITWVSIAPAATPAVNPAFDVTPARLVTGLITERGVCTANRAGLLTLYPERRDR
ncbi:methylthioribose-1-phosphate isomerase [bacterium BMS3Bbin14]|nr:methylthioribose-1-phosphate isomerase [bacterium BMS3Abin13]GBE51576.1 methylthioribose-1-phosphate isomerase [bacterium BMS3Bbin14]HDK43676.1 S-methyl-5-thioribose-1-phosphate isomerase [Desulfobacteraceae bacterium]HDO30212.1 S-methyl-5-thioribose-1-phosphate isomerase [Desulfobacteraceae bacterium]HDZ75913.1 S-methyl-5-thioribose-1-phosphate isomerase [Desulfobacteraceae bacterium]